MAAELLDIEAKLDTSQVQGQLNQLSKTSGLQNLDRAIKTLENSMKKLSAALDKQATQAATRGGADAHLLGRNGLLLGRTPLARALGATYAGKMLDQFSGTLTKATGNWKAGAIADTMGSALKGAWLGPLGMAMGAIQGATDAVSKRFAELAEISNKLIEAKTKEWEATDKAFASIEAEVKDIRMRAASANMSPEERRKEIDRLQTARSEAVSNMAYNYDIAKTVEGPMYDAAVAAAQYWRDAVKDIDKNLSILRSDNDKYNDALMESAKAAAQVTKEEQHIAEQREKIKEGFAADLRGSEFSQWKDRAGANADQLGESQLRGNIFVTQASLQDAMQKYQQTLREAIQSEAPEDFVDKLKDMATNISELEDVLEMWKQALESLPQAAFDLQAPLGQLNALEQAGYFGMASQDKTIEDLTQQILNYVRRITANTETQTSTNDETFGNY